MRGNILDRVFDFIVCDACDIESPNIRTLSVSQFGWCLSVIQSAMLALDRISSELMGRWHCVTQFEAMQ